MKKSQKVRDALRPEDDLLMEPLFADTVSAMNNKGTIKDALDIDGGEIGRTSPEEVLDFGERRSRVAILSDDGFEEEELLNPKAALENAGIDVDVVAPKGGYIKGWDKTDWGDDVSVDKELKEANAREYDAIILPGGVMNPDKLRQNKDAIHFVSQFIRSGKIVAAICHGPQTLIETGLINGTTMTSYPSIQTDLRNAGVNWVDRDVVHHGQFITSRKPADLVAFNTELIDALSLHVH